MKATELDRTDIALWEDYVNSSSRTVAWQSYQWSEAVDRLYPIDFYPLALEDGGEIKGILPLYRLKGPKSPSRLFSVPFAVAGGLTADDPEGAAILLKGAWDLMKRLGVSGLTLKQYRYPVEGPLKSDTSYFNRELQLQPGPSQLWDQFRPENRKAIESAERNSLRLEYPSDRFDLFYDMLLGFMTRTGMPCPSRRWLQTLLDLRMYRIALLERNERVVCGTMVKAFRDTVSFPMTCIRSRKRDSYDSTYALYWYLIRSFAEQGYGIFHSGRMPNSEDAEAYRLGWGGEKFGYHYQYFPKTEGATESTRKRGWKRKAFSECWKYMPKSIARTVGPRIIRRYP